MILALAKILRAKQLLRADDIRPALRRPLGERETGGGLALPIWIGYMGKALPGRAEVTPDRPEGIVEAGGEIYYAEFPPGGGVASVGLEDSLPPEEKKKAETVRDQIF